MLTVDPLRTGYLMLQLRSVSPGYMVDSSQEVKVLG